MNTSQQFQYNSLLANHPRPAIALTAITYLLLGYLETLPGTFIPPLSYFLALGVLALYLTYVLGLPNGRKSLREYCQDIRLLPMTPLGSYSSLMSYSKRERSCQLSFFTMYTTSL